MRHYPVYFVKNKTITILLLILFISFSQVFGQNRYLSFSKDKKESENKKTLPLRKTKKLDSKAYQVSFQFSGAFISDNKVENTNYNYLHIDGFSKMGQIGAPALPAKNEIIAVPRGAETEIVILEADYIEYSGYMIHPTLEPARDTEGAPEPEFKKDEEIYSSNEFFPKKIVEITNTGISRGTQLVYVELRPVQFNPVTGVIRVYKNIRYKLVKHGGEENFDYIKRENSTHYRNMLKRKVINSDDIPQASFEEKKENEKDNEGASNYIIITHSKYNVAANALANWKRQLGYSVELVSKSSWTADEVKTAIHSRYAAWIPKPDYFVIIGDHTGTYAVPGEVHNVTRNETFATDLYFACMDGNSDWHPDMAKGRISVSSANEALIVVNKIIKYEKNPPTTASYYTNALSCAQYQDNDNNGYADRRFCHTSENIRDYLQNQQGYSSQRIYYSSTRANKSTLKYNNKYYSDGGDLPEELRDANFNWNGGESEITNSINAGKFMVFHRDHGYSGGSGWAHPYYTTSTMTNLTNGDLLPVIFSMNCHTGEFQLDNCFAEKLLRMENKGAVGVVGAAYYSLSGYNDGLSLGMIDAIWSDPGLYPVMGTAGTGSNYTIGKGNNIYTMGDVLNQGLYAMEQNVSWSSSRKYEYELFHYFGDPAMKIWTSNPNDNIITATHNSDIECSSTSLTISNSEANATASLVLNNKLLSKTTLDESGNGTLNYTITTVGNITLTISKHNAKPYVSTLTQTGSCDYPPNVIVKDINSVTDVTATLSGEITYTGTTTITESGFVYATIINPEINGNGVSKVKTDPTVTDGTFNVDISNLSALTKYYVRAYAINNSGITYSISQSFSTDCGAISSLPYTQNFDAFKTSTSMTRCMDDEFYEQECWINDKINDDTDWTPITGATRSGSTGPNRDHTGGGNYVYIEASNCYNHTAYLETPIFDFSQVTKTPVLTFYYYMYGSDMGTLQIDLYYNGSWHNAINTNWNGTYATNISGNQGFDWYMATVDISEAKSYSDVKIRFNGLTGSQYKSDIAIDDIEISLNPKPTAMISSTSGCETGTVRVSSNLQALQTFYLLNADGSSEIANSGEVNANYYEFTGQVSGTYTGKIKKDSKLSDISAQTILTKKTVPGQASVINGTNTISNFTTPLTYSVTKVNNVNYSWVFPNGWKQTSGTNTNYITVIPSETNGDIVVTPSNECGIGTKRTLTVKIANLTAVVSSKGGCKTGTIKVGSNFQGLQTFYLLNADGSSEIANSGEVNTNYYDFTGQVAGTYTGKIERNGKISNISAQTILTKKTVPEQLSIISGNTMIANLSKPLIYSVEKVNNVTYSWKFPDGWRLTSGANRNSIIVMPSTTSGNIMVTASNECGSGSSRTLVVTMNDAISINKQPSNLNVCKGSSDRFTIEAIGIGLKYQWKKGKSDIPNATNSTYLLINVSDNDAGNYSCVVTNGKKTKTSNIVILSIDKPTKIIRNPKRQTINENENVSFEVSATGSNLSYQWKKIGSLIPNAINSKYTIENITINDADYYYCVVIGNCGKKVSDVATLIVNKATSIENIAKNGVNIYPNPSNGIIKLVIDKQFKKASLIISNTNGNQIFTKDLHTNEITVDLRNKAKGIYFIKLIIDGEIINSKIIIE